MKLLGMSALDVILLILVQNKILDLYIYPSTFVWIVYGLLLCAAVYYVYCCSLCLPFILGTIIS